MTNLPAPDLTMPSIEPDGPDGAHFYRASTVRALLAAAPAVSAQSVDVERLIRECLPGGHGCDPQRVADDIRAWFQAPGATPTC